MEELGANWSKSYSQLNLNSDVEFDLDGFEINLELELGLRLRANNQGKITAAATYLLTLSVMITNNA